MFLMGGIDDLIRASIYLAKPSGEILGCLDEYINEQSCKLVRGLNQQQELSFTIQSNLNDWYEYIQEGMYLYLEKDGLFRITQPTIECSGVNEVKTVVAKSCDVELEDKNLQFEINMGTKTSLENIVTYNHPYEDENIINPYTGIPYDWIVIYNTFPEQLENHLSDIDNGVYGNTAKNHNEAIITDSVLIEKLQSLFNLIPRLKNRFIKIGNEDPYDYELEEFAIVSYGNDGETVTSITLDSSYYNRVVYLKGFYTSHRDSLSLLSLVLEKTGGTWTVGDIYGVSDGDYTIANKKYQFEVSENIYSFLTTSLAQASECMVLFDILSRKVNIIPVDKIGSDTGLIISYDNLLNTLNIEPNENNLITRLYMYGDDDLSISQVNFGLDYIDDLSYKVNATDSNGNRIFVSDELALKYSNFVDYRETLRDEYIEIAKRYSEYIQRIDDIKYRVPLDDLKNDWGTFSLEELEISLSNFKNLMAALISMYRTDYYPRGINPDDSVDETFMKSTMYWFDYDAYKSVIKEIECAISTFPYYSDQTKWNDYNIQLYKDAITAWETDWTLYGTIELQGKIDSYKSNMDILAESSVIKTSDDSDTIKTWSELTADEKASFGDIENNYQYDVYMDYYNNMVDAKAYLATLLSQIEDIEADIEADNSRKLEIVDAVSYENNFTADEIKILSLLLKDSDCVNNNILVTTIDTVDKKYETMLELLEYGQEQLSKLSRPQLHFTVSSDNLLELIDYQEIKSNFVVGNYILVQYKDDTYVKVRLIGYSYNPFLPSPDSFEITFSNYVRSKVEVSDLENLLGLASSTSSDGLSGSSRGGKSSGYGSSDDIDVTLSNTMLAKLLNSETFGTRVKDVILNTIDVNSITARYATFNGLANGVTTIDGQCITTGWINSIDYNGVDGSVDNTAGSILNLNTGNFNFGGGSIKYVNDTLKVTGAITAESLSTGGRTSSATGHNGLFIDSDGNLYSGSNNGVILYNNGQFNLANKITYNGTTVSIAGDVLIGGSDSASQIIDDISTAQATADSKTHIFYGSVSGTFTGVIAGDYLVDSSTGTTYQRNSDNNAWITLTKTGILYATCNTGADVAAKVASCDKAVSLFEGLTVSVKFTNANTVYNSALTLKVGNLTAKNILVGDSDTSSANKMFWAAGATITFLYNGSKWLFADQPQTYSGSCTTTAATASKVSSVPNAVVVKGTVANITFTNINTASLATLNIIGAGENAPTIYANGTTLSANSQFNWNENATVGFTFDGSRWNMNDTSALYNTNSYMKFEGTGATAGLMIANMRNGVLGNSSILTRNILLQSDGLKIRNGQDVLASYGDSIILYKPGTNIKAVEITPETATFVGSITATSGSFVGEVTATSLTLGSGVTIPYGSVSSTPDLTVYIQKDGKLGSLPSNIPSGTYSNTGFKVSSDGLLVASNAVIYGTIYASDGEFTGKITATSLDLVSNNVKIPYGSVSDTPDLTIYVQQDGKLGKLPVTGATSSTYTGFRVSHEGLLEASNACIYGTIYASDGIFSGDIIARSLDLTTNNVKIPYSSLSSTPDLTVYIQKDGTLGIVPDQDATSSTSTGFQVTQQGLLTASNALIFGTVYASKGKFTGEIVANSGYIGGTSGWHITSKKIYSGTVDSGTSNGDVTLSTEDFSRIINGASRTGLRFAIGSKFGVTNSGTLYAHDLIATGGSIGGFTIKDGYLTTNTSRSSYDSTTSGLTIDSNGIGGYSSSSSYFTMTTGGKLTCVGAEITGKITANSGYIGGTSGWHITSNKIYSGTVDSGTSSGDVTLSTTDFYRYIDTKKREGLRFAIGSNFGISNTGTVYAANAVLSGSITAATNFSLGGAKGIRNDSSGRVLIGDSITVDNDGHIIIKADTEIWFNSSSGASIKWNQHKHFMFNQGLISYGNIIASYDNSTRDGSIRAETGLFVGTGTKTQGTDYKFHVDSTGSVYCASTLDCGALNVKNSSGTTKASINSSGEISCAYLSSSGNLNCTGTLTCGTFSPSTITASGDIKSSYSSDRYARMSNNDYINSNYSAVVETRYGSTRYVRMSTGSNSSYFEVYYNGSHYTTINGYYGITVVGGNITAPSLTITDNGNISGANNISCTGTLSCGSFSPSSITTGSITGTSLSLSNGSITNAYNITATGNIKGKSLELTGTNTSSITGAYNITASNNIDGTFIGKVRTTYSTTNSYYPIGSTTTASRYCSIINTGVSTSDYVRVYGSYGLQNGSQTYNDIFITTSDIRLKQNVSDSIFNGLETIMKIRHRQFDWKRNGRHNDVGYIAQELKAIDPNLVNIADEDDDNAMYSVNTLYLLSVTTKALQELITEVDTLKSRIDELEEAKEK